MMRQRESLGAETTRGVIEFFMLHLATVENRCGWHRYYAGIVSQAYASREE